MRAVFLIVAFLFAAPASAQSPMFQAHAALESCVYEKAAEYAGQDGSLRDIAAAAFGACGDEAGALRDAYRIHYEHLGTAYATAATQAATTTDALIRDIEGRALSIIAEQRLGKAD